MSQRSIRTATVAILALLVLPFIYNSCQGNPIGSNFNSAQTCSGGKAPGIKPGEVHTLGKALSDQGISPFAHKKVQLATTVSSSGAQAQFKASEAGEVVLSSGTHLVALVDNECLSHSQNFVSPFLENVIGSARPMPGLRRQAYGYTLSEDTSTRDIEAQTAKDSCLVGLSFNKTYRTSATFSDPWAFYQSHLKTLRAEQAYDEFFHQQYGMKTTGTPEVIIAIVDTGVDWQHPDLHDNMWVHQDGYGIDATTIGMEQVDFNPFDVSPIGHGTHVAGLAAAITNNELGSVGLMAHRAKIMGIKVFRPEEESFATTSLIVANGIRFAIANKADVINLSLGRTAVGADDDPIYLDAVTEAVNAGIVVVAAIGNGDNTNVPQEMDGENFTVLPAKYGAQIGGMITVGSFDAATGQRSFFSHYSTKYGELAAPGTERDLDGLYSTIPTGIGDQVGYGRLAGTSMAAPLVSAAAGLVIGQLRETYGRKPTPAEVERLLIQGSPKSADLKEYFKDGRRLDLLSLVQQMHTDYPETAGLDGGQQDLASECQ